MGRRGSALALLAATCTVIACGAFGSSSDPEPSVTPTDEAGARDGDLATDDGAVPVASCSVTTPGSGPPPLHPGGSVTTTCPSGTFDLETSSKNCGTCDRICPSGTCVKGACGTNELANIASEQLTVHGISAGQVIFSSSYAKQEIYAVSTTGAVPAKVWSASDVAPDGAAVVIRGVAPSTTDTTVFFFTDNKAYAQTVPAAGGAPGAVVPIEGIGPIDSNAVAVSDGIFYVSMLPNNALNRQIARVTRTSGKPVVVAALEPYAFGLTRRGPVIYWAREPSNFAATGDGMIARYDTDTTSTRYSAPLNVRGRIAVDDDYVYYFDDVAKELRRLPQDLPDGAQPATLASWKDAEVNAHSMSVSGNYVYVALAKPNTPRARVIARVPRCGGEPIIVARDDANEFIRGHAVVDGRLVFAQTSKVLSTDP